MITKIRISGYRIFDDFELDPNPALNIIVGANESGKSTLLEAVCLALTWRVNGRRASEELNPYWFNARIVKEFVRKRKDGKAAAFPEIHIELYFQDRDELQELCGAVNDHVPTLACPGVRVLVFPNTEYADELEEWAKTPSHILPVEYYKVEWRSFADRQLTIRPKALKTAIIDSRTVRSTTGVDYHMKEILGENLETDERAAMSLAYRRVKESMSDTALKNVNRRIRSLHATLHNQPITLEMDQSARSSWEWSVTPHVADVPFSMSGQGQQAAIKIALAMNKHSSNTRFVTIEEPENHLSHTSLNILLSQCKTQPASYMANHLTLAVAGSRKTQGLVEHCASLPVDRRILVLTYTQANQIELRTRLATYAGGHTDITVMGWFTFLLRDFARPFVPFKFPGQRILGFDFDGRPHMKASGLRRFLDRNGSVYRCELGRLAHELVAESGGKLLRRLECIYDEILVDEVQDLSSHDWEIVDVLLRSSVDIRMVGDIRQAILSTNPRSAKNKKYAYADAFHWFREREQQGLLRIEENAVTWRCNQTIADFSDTIFDPGWGFPSTISRNDRCTEHDGMFLLRKIHVDAYIQRFRPRCLRATANSGRALDLDYMNFGVSKGMQFERVLIAPTGGILKFIQKGSCLEPRPAASLYVAVTRAEQSVAIVVDEPGDSALPYWEP